MAMYSKVLREGFIVVCETYNIVAKLNSNKTLWTMGDCQIRQKNFGKFFISQKLFTRSLRNLQTRKIGFRKHHSCQKTKIGKMSHTTLWLLPIEISEEPKMKILIDYLIFFLQRLK